MRALFWLQDTSHNGEPCQGRGEICIRGPNVFKGYYKDEEKTKEAIDDEGWLHSGDVGLWTMDGQLKIIDRKKNIFKLAQGGETFTLSTRRLDSTVRLLTFLPKLIALSSEYVAAEKIENVLNQSLLIGQSFVHGESLQTYLVAIIVPDEEPVRAWAKENIPDSAAVPFSDLCKNEKLKQEILSEVRRVSKLNGLQGFETVKAVHLEPHVFTPESELVTPTFKLKRPQLKKHYENEIDEMYAHPPSKL